MHFFLLGPVMRPSQKASEEREWVVNAINKYFDVIVEEEEEEEEDDGEIDEEDDELDSEIDSEDEELESISDIDYQDSDEDEEHLEGDDEARFNADKRSDFKSTAKIRGLLSTAMTKISSSRGDLSDQCMQQDQKQGLLNNLKQKLGSQISLKRRSQDYLNVI